MHRDKFNDEFGMPNGQYAEDEEPRFTNCNSKLLFPAPKDGKTILEQTALRGFQIRVWDYQEKEWCRVSIGTLDEMKQFVKAFDEVVAWS